MKLFASAVFLVLLALTRAQDESNLEELSQIDELNQVEQFQPGLRPFDESRPSRPVEDERRPRPGKPDRPPLAYRLPWRQPSEVEHENALNHRNEGHPPRQTVAFDIKFDFGQGNQIYEN